jgi:Ricin-type beta-trefoil lectin domain
MAFYIESVNNPEMYLDVLGGSTADGTQIIQHEFNDGRLNQQWEIIRLHNDSYLIVNVQSSKALDVAYASQENGAQIVQYRVHGGANQQWILRHLQAGPTVGDTNRYVIVSMHSNKALDVAYASQENGAQIVQYQVHGGANQQWRIIEVGTRSPATF